MAGDPQPDKRVKNQSSFICELIMKEMREGQSKVSREDLKQKILDSSASVIQEEIRNEIRTEFREFKCEFFENFIVYPEDEDS